MKKWWLLLLVLAPLSFASVGCEADGDVGDDDASLKIEVDD